MKAFSKIRPVLHAMPPQGIDAIFAYGQTMDHEVIPMWFGESDLSTPEPPRRAAVESLGRGETFYAAQSGMPELRRTIAEYMSRLHGRTIGADRVTVTASGMVGIHVALQTLLDPGDNIVLITPLWPNAEGAAQLQGAEVRRVALQPDEDGRWHLDVDALAGACDARTRVIFINSPNNPTGWLCPAEQQQAILDFARQRGIWILADEVYSRIVYDRELAPSFVDIAEPEDLVIAVNSFSKSWAMTGWRLGWLVAPPSLFDTLGNVIQYTNSNSPAFVQHGGIAAIRECEPFVAEFRAYCARGRDIVCDALGRLNRVRIAPPEAALYAFFSVEGEPDSMALAKRLVKEAGVGVAPGISFGPESEGWMRLCFAQDPALLERGLRQMTKVLGD